MRIFIIFAIFITGCTNVSTTRLSYTDVEGRTSCLEFPKELEAKNLKVVLNFEKGTVEIVSDNIKTFNVETIKAQGDREENFNDIIEKASEGAARGAMKAIVPTP